MIERIFISTNANLHGIFGGRDYANLQARLTNSGLSLLNSDENHKVYFNGTGFDMTTTSSSIIVVKDSSETSLTGINPLTDLLLHHTQTDNHIRNVVENFEGKKVQGRHPDLYYTDVFKIIFNDAITDKLSEILKVLDFTDKEVEEKETLESKLNFLHHCLTPDGLINAEVTNSEWANLDEFTKLKSTNDGPFGDNYLSVLRALRDKLLVS